VSRLERWRARLGYAWETGRRAGAGPLVRMALRGLLEPLIAWRTYDFYNRDVTAPIAPYAAAIPLEIRIATDEDFARFLPALLSEGTTPEEIEARRQADAECFLGVSGERLAHFTWLLRRPVWLAELGATLRLGPDESYAVFSYTAPEFRGKGVHPAVVNWQARWEQTAGIRRHYSFVMRHNLPARRIMTRHEAGTTARVTRTVRTVRIAFVPGFLAHGLGNGEPRLEPGPAVDLGVPGLWIRAHGAPRSRHSHRVRA
jgi:GNAT superfamily N-acetyltransferase